MDDQSDIDRLAAQQMKLRETISDAAGAASIYTAIICDYCRLGDIDGLNHAIASFMDYARIIASCNNAIVESEIERSKHESR